MSHAPPFVIPLRKSYLVTIIDMFANTSFVGNSAGASSIGGGSAN